ncbi:hypothetical protein HQ585_17615 [candidate division KSB1 bacterium]|nr:hypothetical protein [candidate division KSB1 bacterium]
MHKEQSRIKQLGLIALIVVLICMGTSEGWAQDRIISLGVKWLRVSDLHSTFAIEGAEFEMHRTGNLPEQSDGMRWPAQFKWQDCSAAKGMMIGTTDFQDPVSGELYAYKTACVGYKRGYPDTEIMPYEFYMVGRFPAPLVTVDGMSATDNKLNDVVDVLDPDLKPDRMIVHKMHTSIGIDITRKLMAFSQQNHGNYFVYEYTLKNTGIIDLDGNTFETPRTLTDVGFSLQFRYATGNEAFKRGWSAAGAISWGLNTVNQVVGEDPTAASFTDPNSPIHQMRAFYAWYGPHSVASWDDWGAPEHERTGTLGAVQYPGGVTLHCDDTPNSGVDDLYQPKCTWYLEADGHPFAINQYDPQLMTEKYTEVIAPGDPPMSEGHPPNGSHADQVGDGFADQWTSDSGGIMQSVGYGVWDLAPGDSIKIVLAEGVSGIDRALSLQVGQNWIDGITGADAPMPDGSPSSDPDAYKEAWVKTGVDSIIKTLQHARYNFANNYDIPQPPPPPEAFQVESGGDRIFLSWADNATSDAHFNGYEVYRAIHRADTLYEMIYTCDKSNVAHSYEDRSAKRGFNYYYYVVSKDDGTQNEYQTDVPLVSSKFYTITNQPARLQRPAAERLEDIRVVPNPFHIKARDIQFGVGAPDQIAFFGLPPFCDIKIYTERGDLINTIVHANGTGDDYWDSNTMYNQIVVSGLYIAFFEVTEDVVDEQTGQLIFKKGDNAFRKFVVIR